MIANLKQYFPILWEKNELLNKISNDKYLSAIFYKWTPEQQQQFVDSCTGVRGMKLLYDGFFKEIMNAEYTPERLDDFLSLLLQKNVRVHAVLPNDSTRIADESSLLITDLVVELDDGSLANVEIQKIGYNFPGQRSACYSADMLLRQYKRIRSLKKKKFHYRDIKDVYIIVLFEHSTSEFHNFPDDYLHYFSQRSNTGLELELLQKFVFVALDIFQEIQHNKIINSKLDAWLLFLTSDNPKDILRLISEYPEFQAMYEQAYAMCRNLEEIMGFFSEELRILDRNTVQYMIDEMQEKIDEMSDTISNLQEEIDDKQFELDEKQSQLDEKQSQLDEKQSQLDEKQSQLDEKDLLLQKQQQQLEELERHITELKNKL